ncbi:MAG: VOC family protein [Pseudomonadota bacterium]
MNENNGLGAIRSLDYVIVLCDDLKKMKRFYDDIFGFYKEEVSEHLAAFRVGTLYLCLRTRGRSYDGLETPEHSAGIQLSFRVPPADVDLAYQALKNKNIEFIEPPTNQDWPHRTLFFKDPENNILEIFADIHTDETLPEPSGKHLVTGRQAL